MNLSAKIIEIYPIATEMEICELMTKEWGNIPSIITGEKKYSYGRLREISFYTKIQPNGELLNSDKCFQINFEDVGEYILGNNRYIKILETKKIILTDTSLNQVELDKYTATSIKKIEKAKLYKKRRQKLIDKLKSDSINTSIETAVKQLSIYFETEILRYINDGTDDFQNAILNCTDSTILGYLSQKLIIGYDGVIGATSGTTPIYFSKNINGTTVELTLKEILLDAQNHWK